MGEKQGFSAVRRFKFKAGGLYRLFSFDGDSRRLRYIRDVQDDRNEALVGVRRTMHLFRHPEAGWFETFTDAQLIRYVVIRDRERLKNYSAGPEIETETGPETGIDDGGGTGTP